MLKGHRQTYHWIASPGPFTWAFVRLEPGAVKIACPVLRGGNGGNAVPLPDVARSRDLIRELDEPGGVAAGFI